MNSLFQYFLKAFLLFFIISPNKYSTCIIIIPFEIVNPNYDISTSKDLMSYLNSLSLNSNISLGTPPQEVKTFIKFDKSGFNIPNNAYNHKNSKTYQELSESQIISDEIEYNGTFSSDDLILINTESNEFTKIIKNIDSNINTLNEKYKKVFKNITFINKLTDEIGYKDYGYIGLKFPDKDKFDIINFVPLLKSKNITNNYAWTLLFEKKNCKNKDTYIIDCFNGIKGKLILGDELHNYYPIKYMSNVSYNVNMIQRNNYLNWDLEFSNIYIGDNKLYIYSGAEIRPDSPLYYGSLGFKLNLDSFFFSPLFNQSICESKNMTLYPNLIYYMCDSSKKGQNNLSFDIKSFPNITFEHKRLGGNFTLNYKDVFIQDIYNKNIFYFLFVFDRNKIFNANEDRFILGTKFFEKYQFEFDNDKKLIRYYDIINNNICDNFYCDNNKDKKDYKIILFICLIILFGIILFVLGMLFQKKILKLPRKARANELDEDFEYKSKNDEKNEDVRIVIDE